ncbi:ABC transporter permease [Streptomyces sp. NPDC046821]|uniref:ABC transporter permease n=1 Tax=Streptomyces sp. NPDC046821 TaxID=3154702 RepID=UPI0033CF3A8F
MNRALYAKSLSDHRRGLTGWAVGTAAVATMYASTYPSQKDSTANLPEAMREAMHIDASAAGYLQASVFGLILPLLAMVYGVATGTRAVAADEEAGQLDLILAHPVPRTRLVLQRFAALATGALVIAFPVWLAMLAIRDSAELTSVTPGQLLAQCTNLALLSIVFGALAIALGAGYGRRVPVLVTAAVIGVLAYAAHTFAGQLGADWLAYLSPFHYYIAGQPLRHGFQWGDAAVLVGMAAALVGAAIMRLNSRDLRS